MITLYLGLGFVLICGIGGATTSTNWNYDNQAQVLHKLVVEPGFTNRSQVSAGAIFAKIRRLLKLTNFCPGLHFETLGLPGWRLAADGYHWDLYRKLAPSWTGTLPELPTPPTQIPGEAGRKGRGP